MCFSKFVCYHFFTQQGYWSLMITENLMSLLALRSKVNRDFKIGWKLLSPISVKIFRVSFYEFCRDKCSVFYNLPIMTKRGAEFSSYEDIHVANVGS